MSKKTRFLRILLVFLIAAAITTGCEFTADDAGPSIYGSWVGPEGAWQDGYNISSTRLIYYSPLSSQSIAYAGDVVESSYQTSTNGYIVILITANGGFYTNYIVGKYTVVKWEELKKSSSKIAGPFVDGSGLGKECFETKDEAKDNLLNNTDAYAMMGSYTR